MLRSKLIVGLIAGGILGAAPPANADAVMDWNAIALDAVTIERPGTIGLVDVALVQVAVHDAVQALDRRFEPYLAEIDGAHGRRSAAVAAAAHDVLAGMYPNQAEKLDALYYSYLADHGLDGDPALLVGQQVAARILPLRRANPNPLPPPFLGGTAIGQWRPTDSFLGNPQVPAPFSPMAVPWMAGFDPFTLTSPTRFPQTAGDPAWQPLINNPNYPDFSSGANSVTGAVTRTLELFFGTDRLTFDVTTLAPLAIQKTRTYHRLSDAMQDVVNARVWLGIHFRTTDLVGRAQGRRVADWTFNHFLLPLDPDHGR